MPTILLQGNPQQTQNVMLMLFNVGAASSDEKTFIFMKNHPH